MELKCSKCGDVKDCGEFHKHKRHKSGFSPNCKTCKGAIDKKYREENKEKLREYNLNYKTENKKILKEKQEKYEIGRASCRERV